MLIFLKLGGSLITDKNRPYTARLDKINTLAQEIASAIQEQPNLDIVIGHGSGSFGHQAASRYNTREGVSSKEEWQGFADVWYQASVLNRLVVDALHHEGVPAVTVSPFSSIISKDGRVLEWNHQHISTAIAHRLIPIIHGDVLFDEIRGGTILSTEELFLHLGYALKPGRILLAGMEEGIWQDFPKRDHLVKEITPSSHSQIDSSLGRGMGVDITGGMQGKVAAMLSLVAKVPGMEVVIFSGEKAGNILQAIGGEAPGTRIHN